MRNKYARLGYGCATVTLRSASQVFFWQLLAICLQILTKLSIGSVDRRSENTTNGKTKTCKTTKQQLTPQLTHESQKQPKTDTAELPADLAEIVAVWPELPVHIKAAIKALIETNCSKGKT